MIDTKIKCDQNWILMLNNNYYYINFFNYIYQFTHTHTQIACRYYRTKTQS